MKGRSRIRALQSVFSEALRGSGEKASDEMVQNWNATKKTEIKRNMWRRRNVLVQAGSVGVFILLDNGNDQRDELGPKIQVLDAGALLFWRHSTLLGLEMQEHDKSYSRLGR